MKVNLKRSQIEVDPDPDNPGRFVVTKGCAFIPEGYQLSRESIVKYFEAADCIAQIFIEAEE